MFLFDGWTETVLYRRCNRYLMTEDVFLIDPDRLFPWALDSLEIITGIGNRYLAPPST